jgi:hypothetical protein
MKFYATLVKISAGKTIQVRKNQQEIKNMFEIQLDLLVSYIGPMAIIKLPKKQVQIKWNKKVR